MLQAAIIPITVVFPVPVAILQEVRARLAEEDDGLGGLDLGEEQRMPSPFPPPVAQQLHGGAGHPAFAAQGQGPPFGELGADAADQLQLDGRPDPLVLGRLAPRRPVEVPQVSGFKMPESGDGFPLSRE